MYSNLYEQSGIHYFINEAILYKHSLQIHILDEKWICENKKQWFLYLIITKILQETPP